MKSIKKLILLITILFSLNYSFAQTFKVDTLYLSGPTSNRQNIVFMGDGFQSSQQTIFKNKAIEVKDTILGYNTISIYDSLINVFAIEVISTDTGIIKPIGGSECTYPSGQAGLTPNTYFKCTFNAFNICRYIEPPTYSSTSPGSLNPAVPNVMAASLPFYINGANNFSPVIICNTKYYGGGEFGATATCTMNILSDNVVVHELGHSLFGLGDEYVYTVEAWNNTNVSNPTTCRWSYWIPPCGLFTNPGGGYSPLSICEMRALQHRFCNVCAERIATAFGIFLNYIDSYSPTSASTITLTTGQSQTFTAKTLRPHPYSLSITWTLDGQTRPNGKVYNDSIPAGTHTVVVSVTDTTHLIRNPSFRHTYTHSWTIITNGAPIPPAKCNVATNLSVSGIGQTFAQLSWTGTGVSYKVLFNGIIYPLTNTSISFVNLTPGTTYNWQVKTYCIKDSSSWSSISTFNTQSPPPPPPSNPCASPSKPSLADGVVHATYAYIQCPMVTNANIFLFTLTYTDPTTTNLVTKTQTATVTSSYIFGVVVFQSLPAHTTFSVTATTICTSGRSLPSQVFNFSTP